MICMLIQKILHKQNLKNYLYNKNLNKKFSNHLKRKSLLRSQKSQQEVSEVLRMGGGPKLHSYKLNVKCWKTKGPLRKRIPRVVEQLVFLPISSQSNSSRKSWTKFLRSCPMSRTCHLIFWKSLKSFKIIPVSLGDLALLLLLLLFLLISVPAVTGKIQTLEK